MFIFPFTDTNMESFGQTCVNLILILSVNVQGKVTTSTSRWTKQECKTRIISPFFNKFCYLWHTRYNCSFNSEKMTIKFCTNQNLCYDKNCLNIEVYKICIKFLVSTGLNSSFGWIRRSDRLPRGKTLINRTFCFLSLHQTL